MKKVIEYQVIEDNGGGLHLFVFDGGVVVRGISNLEYLTHDDFMANINALKSGDDGSNWEGLLESPADIYEELNSYEFGVSLVGDENEVYPERMGRAAQLGYGIDGD